MTEAIGVVRRCQVCSKELSPACRDWIDQAVKGDRLAAQKLIVLHHPRLRRLAARRWPAELRGKLEPEDILQQVYVDVVQRITEFRNAGNDSFFHWLVRILDSRLIDARRYLRAAARNPAREASARESQSSYPALVARAALDSLTPSRVVRRREGASLLMAALAGLSPDHRQVLELRFLQGHSLVDVAKVMQRSPAAAQMLCARALRQLRTAVRSLSAFEL